MTLAVLADLHVLPLGGTHPPMDIRLSAVQG
jgi:hypothetical protein